MRDSAVSFMEDSASMLPPRRPAPLGPEHSVPLSEGICTRVHDRGVHVGAIAIDDPVVDEGLPVERIDARRAPRLPAIAAEKPPEPAKFVRQHKMKIGAADFAYTTTSQ